MPDFADRLKQLRLQRKLTQEELAKALNVTQNAIFNWENAKREPNMDMISKMADLFNVPMSYLMEGNKIYGRFVREFIELANGKIPAALQSSPIDSGIASSNAPGQSRMQPAALDFMVKDESGETIAILELNHGDGLHNRLLAYVTALQEWHERTCEPLNEEGQKKVAEFAQALSETPKYQRKPDEPT